MFKYVLRKCEKVTYLAKVRTQRKELIPKPFSHTKLLAWILINIRVPHVFGEGGGVNIVWDASSDGHKVLD